MATDLVQSHAWTVKAAEAGDLDAMTVTGIDLLNGKSVTVNAEEAIRWLTTAAEKGDAIAAYELGNVFRGLVVGAPAFRAKPNIARADAAYRKAIAGGSKEATDRLAALYEGGLGVEPEWARAFAIRKPLADAGDPMSEVYIGLYYERGYGVPADIKVAAEWFAKSARHGSARGNFELGRLYFDGEGVPKSEKLAIQYMRQAAVQGFPQALRMMGMILLNGAYGLKNDDVEAEQLIRLAAEKGLPAAAFDLGEMYLFGTGVEKDRAEARKWFTTCATGGDERCIAKLKTLS